MQIAGNHRYSLAVLRPVSCKIAGSVILAPLRNLGFPYPRVRVKQSLPDPDRKSERDLVEALKLGDHKAFSLLYTNYKAALFGIISRTLKTADAAEDAHQETFIKIFKCIAEFDPQKGRLFTWMAKIARNTAIDNLRSKAERNEGKNDNLDEHIDTVENLHPIDFNVETIGIRQLTSALPGHLKQIIDMAYFGGFTHVEIAEKLNMPLGSVKSSIRTAILILRKCFRSTSLPAV